MTFTPKDGFPYYYNLAKDESVHALFSSSATFAFLASIGEEKARYRYAPNKWSICQIVGHITDHERIKMFRAFQMSRAEAVELWGYDQNALVANARFEDLTLQQLVTDLAKVRNASLSFIDTLSDQQLQLKGKAKDLQVTLEAFLRTIIGHERHHLQIIKEKYLRTTP